MELAVSITLNVVLAIFSAWVLWRLHQKTEFSEFREAIADGLSALSAERNLDQTAYEVLDSRRQQQHKAYIKAFAASGYIRRRRLRAAWEEYFGNEDEQEWYFPHEYDTIFSNKATNTARNTRELARFRLNRLLELSR